MADTCLWSVRLFEGNFVSFHINMGKTNHDPFVCVIEHRVESSTPNEVFPPVTNIHNLVRRIGYIVPKTRNEILIPTIWYSTPKQSSSRIDLICRSIDWETRLMLLIANFVAKNNLFGKSTERRSGRILILISLVLEVQFPSLELEILDDSTTKPKHDLGEGIKSGGFPINSLLVSCGRYCLLLDCIHFRSARFQSRSKTIWRWIANHVQWISVLVLDWALRMAEHTHILL